MLEGLGYTVVAAGAEQALELGDRLPSCDLVMVELGQYGNLDGTELAGRLLRLRELPLVLVYDPQDPALSEKAAAIQAHGMVPRDADPFLFGTVLTSAFRLFAANNELRELGKRLEALETGIWEWSPNTDLYLSPRFHAQLGYEEGELATGKSTWRAWVHPEDLDAAEAEIKRALTGASDFRVTLRMLHKTAGWRWFEIQGKASQLDNAGKARRLNGSIHDITERRILDRTKTYQLHAGLPHAAENFFEALARHLADVLGMEYVCIDRLLGDGCTAKTEAIFYEGNFQDNVEYTLYDTPCGQVVGKTVCCFKENVRTLFPRDAALQEIKGESYIGTTLWGNSGQRGEQHPQQDRTEDYSQVRLADYLDHLVREIREVFPDGRRIGQLVEGGDFSLGTQSQFPVGIIVNELVTNALKYAFRGRDQGRITVSATRDEKTVTLVVADDGIGIDDSTRREGNAGFGMQLVNNLVGQIGGTIRQEQDKGTRYTIRFPG